MRLFLFGPSNEFLTFEKGMTTDFPRITRIGKYSPGMASPAGATKQSLAYAPVLFAGSL
jgi:hypothetical protein